MAPDDRVIEIFGPDVGGQNSKVCKFCSKKLGRSDIKLWKNDFHKPCHPLHSKIDEYFDLLQKYNDLGGLLYTTEKSDIPKSMALCKQVISITPDFVTYYRDDNSQKLAFESDGTLRLNHPCYFDLISYFLKEKKVHKANQVVEEANKVWPKNVNKDFLSKSDWEDPSIDKSYWNWMLKEAQDEILDKRITIAKSPLSILGQNDLFKDERIIDFFESEIKSSEEMADIREGKTWPWFDLRIFDIAQYERVLVANTFTNQDFKSYIPNSKYRKILFELFDKHGLFSHIFFRKTERYNLLEIYNMDSNLVSSLNKKIEKYVDKNTFGLPFWKGENRQLKYASKDNKHILADFLFNYHFLHYLSDKRNLDKLCDLLKLQNTKRDCEVCNNKFRIIDWDPYRYYHNEPYFGCCMECRIKLKRPNYQTLEEKFVEFMELIEFIPSPSTLSDIFTRGTIQRINPLKIKKAIEVYAEVECNFDPIKEKYGTYFSALFELELLPDGVLQTKRGIRCVSLDGHECLSLGEKEIDDWLHLNNILHDKEPRYPKHPVYNKSGLRRADWIVNNSVFIEYFGLAGDSNYDEKTAEKFKLCEELGIKIVGIYRDDLHDLRAKLGFLLS